MKRQPQTGPKGQLALNDNPDTGCQTVEVKAGDTLFFQPTGQSWRVKEINGGKLILETDGQP